MNRNHTLLSLLLLLCFVSCKTISVSSSFPIELDEIRVSASYMPMNSMPVHAAAWSTENQLQIRDEKAGEFNLPERSEIVFASTLFKYPENPGRETGLEEYPEKQIRLYAEAAKKYAKEKGFDTTTVFLANMAVLPNKKRFYIVNLNTMSVDMTGLVAHGRGKGRSIYSRQYSNVPGSNCTSLGRYKIAKSYSGTYGFSYRLVGMDKTNNNAETRGIVLHSMGCIPEKEGFAPACVSEGCPAVSTNFLSGISKIIDSKKQPVLLWIFDSLLEEPVVVQTKTNPSAESPAFAIRGR